MGASCRVQADRILFLDACFSVVLFHGATIAQWRKQEFHLQPQYEGFKAMLEVRACLSACSDCLSSSCEA